LSNQCSKIDFIPRIIFIIQKNIAIVIKNVEPSNPKITVIFSLLIAALAANHTQTITKANIANI